MIPAGRFPSPGTPAVWLDETATIAFEQFVHAMQRSDKQREIELRIAVDEATAEHMRATTHLRNRA